MPLIKFVTRRFPPFQAYAFIVGHRDYVDYGFKFTAALPEGKEGISVWLSESEYFDHARQLGEDASSNPQFVPNLIEDCYNREKVLLDVSAKIAKQALKDKSNIELKEMFEEYMRVYLLFTRHLFTPHYVETAFTRSITDWLHVKLKRKGGEKEVSTYFSTIAIATKDTGTSIYERTILELANRILDDKNTSELFRKSPDEIINNIEFTAPKTLEAIDKIEKDYAWFPMVNIVNEPLDRLMIVTALQKAVQDDVTPSNKLEQHKFAVSKQRKEMEEVLKELKPSEELLKQIKELQEFIYLRTYRMEIFGKSHFIIRPLLEEIAARAKLRMLNLKYMTHEEIINFLSSGKRPADGEIEERIKAFAIVLENGGDIKVFGGTVAEEVKKKELEKERFRSISTGLKGTTACKGVAIGPVRIVKSLDALEKIKRGDVLVAIMTTTDYTPVLSKVSAIVTNEGGFTCHAAIISRELGIPCVVGTETATDTLHDDEMVRVDATNGIIYKLEQ